MKTERDTHIIVSLFRVSLTFAALFSSLTSNYYRRLFPLRLRYELFLSIIPLIPYSESIPILNSPFSYRKRLWLSDQRAEPTPQVGAFCLFFLGILVMLLGSFVAPFFSSKIESVFCVVGFSYSWWGWSCSNSGYSGWWEVKFGFFWHCLIRSEIVGFLLKLELYYRSLLLLMRFWFCLHVWILSEKLCLATNNKILPRVCLWICCNSVCLCVCPMFIWRALGCSVIIYFIQQTVLLRKMIPLIGGWMKSIEQKEEKSSDSFFYHLLH